MKKAVMAADLFCFLLVFRNIINAQIIVKYRIIQTGANTQLGGVRAGFCKEWYQSKLIIIF